MGYLSILFLLITESESAIVITMGMMIEFTITKILKEEMMMRAVILGVAVPKLLIMMVVMIMMKHMIVFMVAPVILMI